MHTTTSAGVAAKEISIVSPSLWGSNGESPVTVPSSSPRSLQYHPEKQTFNSGTGYSTPQSSAELDVSAYSTHIYTRTGIIGFLISEAYTKQYVRWKMSYLSSTPSLYILSREVL